MENTFDSSMPNEASATNPETKLSLTPIPLSVPSLGVSLVNEDSIDPPKKKATTTTNKNIISELPVYQDDPLKNIGKFTKSTKVTGHETPSTIDLDKYTPYIGKSSLITTQETLDKNRAHLQTGWEQFKNASSRIVQSVVPEIVSQTANLLDLEDYNNADQEVGNWISKAMTTIKEDINESNPIYQAEQKPLNVSDSGWWFENGSSLVTSALGFVGAGYIAGAGIGKIFGTAGKGAQWLRTMGATTELGATGQQAVFGVSALTNAIALNQAESVGIGVDTYNQVYQEQLKILQADKKNLDVDNADLDKQARMKAADAASEAISFNKVNILLNLTSASMFLKSPLTTRSLVSPHNYKNLLKTIGLEGSQEYVEEVINDISQNKAVKNVDKPSSYTISDAMEHALSAQGVESGLLGFIGGAGQAAIMKAGKHFPIFRNIDYQKAYIQGYIQSEARNPDFTEEQKDAEARKFALDKTGDARDRVSEASVINRKYAEQQDALNDYKAGDFVDSMFYTAEQIQQQEHLQNAVVNNNPVQEQVASDSLFNMQVLNAFETGTTDGYESLFKSLANLTNEEAKERGLYKDGDEGTSDYFKTKANNYLAKIKTLEQQYNQSQSYINHSDVYALESTKIGISATIDANLSKIKELFSQAEQQYKDRGLSLSKEGKTYTDTETRSGYNLSNTVPGFQNSKLGKEIKSLLQADELNRNSKVKIQDTLDTITSSEFQVNLAQRIKSTREANKRKQEEVRARSRRATQGTTTNQTVNDIGNSITDTSEGIPLEVDDEVTPLPVEGGLETENDTKDDKKGKGTSTLTTKGRSEEQLITKPVEVEFAELSDPKMNEMLNTVKSVVSNTGVKLGQAIDYIKDRINVLNTNRDLYVGNNPQDTDAYDVMLSTLNNILSELEGQIGTESDNIELLETINEQSEKLVEAIQGLTFSADILSGVEQSEEFEQFLAGQIPTMQELMDNMQELTGKPIGGFNAVITTLENATSKEDILEIYKPLVKLYNLSTNGDFAEGYESLRYTSQQKKDIVDRYNNRALFHIPSETYVPALDNISKDKLDLYATLDKLNNDRTASEGYGFRTYNKKDIANKLAYLARQWKAVFTPKTTKRGHNYIEVSKEDIDNLFNSTLDKRVLDPNFLPVGKQIEFVKLDSVTLEDGTIRLASESTIENAPIGISVDGELVDGLYLHDVSWINMTNVAVGSVEESKALIESERQKLLNFRQFILDSSTPVTSTIINRGAGVPILDNSGIIKSVLEQTPNVQIGVIRNGVMYTGINSIVSSLNTYTEKDGMGVISIPYGDTNLVLPTRRMKLNGLQTDSIVNAIRLYLEGQVTPLTKQLDNQYGFNILSKEGLEKYINLFISTKSIKNRENNYESFDDYRQGLQAVPDGIRLLEIANSTILYGEGQDVDSNAIYRSKNDGLERERDLTHLSQFLKKMYTHISLQHLEDNIQVPYINGDQIEVPFKDYTEFSKSNMISEFMSIKFENGTEAYTIQSKITFDMSTPMAKPEEGTTTPLISSDVTPTIGFSDTVTLSNGKEFSIDKVDWDMSPKSIEEGTGDTTDNNITEPHSMSIEDKVLASSQLIKGVNLSTYSTIINSITNDIHIELIDSKGDIDFGLNLNNQINLAFASLDDVVMQYQKANHPKAPFVAEQVQLIKDNRDKVTNAIKDKLSKINGLQQSIVSPNSLSENGNQDDSGDNNTENSGENDGDEKNVWNDLLQYSIDPRTGLTTEVKQMFASVKEQKVSIVNGEKVYNPKTNFLNLNAYVPFDVVFNKLLGIVSKSEVNPQYIDTAITRGDERYKGKPAYIVAMLQNIEANIETSPYLFDVLKTMNNLEEYQLNQVYTALNKTKTNHTYVDEDYDFDAKEWNMNVNKSSRKGVDSLVISEWQNNLRFSNLLQVDDKGKVVLSKIRLERFQDQYNKLKSSEVSKSFNNVSVWLKNIGIELPETVFNNLEKYGLGKDNQKLSFDQLFSQNNGIFKNIADRVNSFNSETQEALDLSEFTLYDDSAFKTLANLISKDKPNLSTDSFKNGKGDTVYGYTNSRYAITRFLDLISNPELLNRLNADVFSGESSWLKFLRNPDGTVNTNSVFSKVFAYGTSDSLKTNKKVKGKSIDELNNKELLKYHLGLFYNRGRQNFKQNIMRIVYPTMSDKANTFILEVPTINVELNQEGNLRGVDVNKLVKQLFYPEIERIKKFQGSPNNVNIKEYKQGGGKFLLFPQLNNIADLFEGDMLKSDVGVTAEMDAKLASAMRAYLSGILSETLTEWREEGIITQEKGVDGTIQAEKLSYIDAKYKKNNKINPSNVTDIKRVALNYVVNTMVANMNIQQLFIGDPVFFYRGGATALDMSIKTFDNMGKRLAAHNAGANDYASDPDETFNVMVIKDHIVTSTVIDYINKLYKGNEKVIEAYKDINSGDAQEYTSLKEHLNLMNKKGEISKEAMDRINETYDKTGKLPKSDVKLILQATKPVYANSYTRDGVNSFLYIKSSSIPLIKEFTQGTPLDVLRKHIENPKNNIQRVAFTSSVKVGQPATVISIFNEVGDIVIPENWETSMIRSIPRKGHGEQQAVPYNPLANQVNDGTQQSKELFTNLMYTEGFKYEGEELTGRQLAGKYIELYRDLFATKTNELKESLGFDEKTGTIRNMKKLQRLLKDEALSRNYNQNDIDGLELNEAGTDFVVPLFFNGSDSKLVALLNSLVDTKIRKRKFKGKSFVLTSDAGINFTEGVTSGIVRIDGKVGKLNAAYNKSGEMVSAEVIIPFKFWDNDGKPLKMEQFLNADGTFDMTRLPAELLEAFSYRIPTSGQNLMSNIKVVGFISDSYGQDTVIAPADFITQMGSDFDVDKLYTHMYNTHYDTETDTLSKITLETEKELERLNRRISTLSTTLKEEELTPEKRQMLRLKLESLKEHPILSLKNVHSAVLQNQILDIHMSIFNNPHEDIQKARVRPIAFGNLPDLAKKLNSKVNNRVFTPLANSYQRFKYMNARAGKSAVGMFSLDMVFNSVAQFVERPLHFTEEINKKLITKYYNVSGQRSNALNDAMSAQKGRYKSEVIEAFMSAALDNENEQLLGKLNINSDTFDFIRASSQLGFTEDLSMSIINHPAVKQYLNNRTKFVVTEISDFNSEIEHFMENISISELQKSITDNIASVDENKAVLSLFNELSRRGRELKSLQSAINSDSAGIGKNLFYSNKKQDQIEELPFATSILGAEELIGQYISKDNMTDEEYKNLLSKGYIDTVSYMIKPNSLGGFAGLYGVVTNNQLWSKLYPILQGVTNQIISSPIVGKTDTSSGVSGEANEKQILAQSYKSLLTSGVYNKTSTYNSIREARQDLLFDTTDHLSLGSIIADIKNKGQYTNSLIDRLGVGKANTTIDLTGSIPTEISYFNAATVEMDEIVLINSAIDMITNPTDLGEYNGESINSRQLLDKMITHQIITGGTQRSNQFIKYIPFSYLKEIGYYSNLESISIGMIRNPEQASNNFRTQYVQHNPASYYNEDISNLVQSTQNEELQFKNEVVAKDIPTDIIVMKEIGPVGYGVYKKVETDVIKFIKIDTLGLNGLLEYDISEPFAGKSNIYINQTINTQIQQNLSPEFIPNAEQVKEYLDISQSGIQDNTPARYNIEEGTIADKYNLSDKNSTIVDKYNHILSEISNNTQDPILSHFAKELLNVTDSISDIPLYVDNNLQAKGALIQGKQIRINPNAINTENELQRVLVEEITHAVLKKELSNPKGEYTKKLESLRDEMKQRVLSKYGEEAFEEMERKVSTRLPLSVKERSVLYPVLNLDEFVANAINNKEFQEFLQSEESTYTTKSLWEKFLDIVKDVLIKLGVKAESNLGAVLHETLNLFDKVTKETRALQQELSVPTYSRTVEYINERFNLTEPNTSRLISKGNPAELAKFINTHIVNVEAVVVEDKVVVQSKAIKDYMMDLSPLGITDEELANNVIGANLPNYMTTLQYRIEDIQKQIVSERAKKNYDKVTELENRLLIQETKAEELIQVPSLLALSDKGFQDLQHVSDILSKGMNSSDILYVKDVLDFWKRAKDMVFVKDNYNSASLVSLYSKIESEAKILDFKLGNIQKKFGEGYMKKYTGTDIAMDQAFDDYKDINFITGKVRDISMYGNKLVNSIFLATKQANIKATDEYNDLLQNFDELVKASLSVLPKINPFDVFAQRNKNGYLTGGLIKPYSAEFYRDRNKYQSMINASNSTASQVVYAKWINETAYDTKLSSIFPPSNEITDKVKEAREKLRASMGDLAYNTWYIKQERKIDIYNEHKEGVINIIVNDYNLTSRDDIKSNPNASDEYKTWIERNSPYNLQGIAFGGKVLADQMGMNIHRYYEVAPKQVDYRDGNFDTIGNTPQLFELYTRIESILNELYQYVPEKQRKELMYGGLPSIEKSILEMYTSERGMELGITPILDALSKSVQSSFDNTGAIAVVPATGKAKKEMRISGINSRFEEIEALVTDMSNDYTLEYSKAPSLDKIKEFREIATDKIAQQKSFDLSKLVKIMSALTLAHKHKAEIEDGIKIANNIIDSYTEVQLKPDGTPVINNAGVVQRKEASDSFPNLKNALDYFQDVTLYGNTKDEEGKGNKIYTRTEKRIKARLENQLLDLQDQKDNGDIDETVYNTTKRSIDTRIEDLGKTRIYSKYGDNVLKYVQLKLMGWNVLGGISNINLGFVANLIEGAGGTYFNTKEMFSAYSMAMSSVAKNLTFNRYTNPTSTKIREAMDKMDVMKDASNELYTSSLKGVMAEKIKTFMPYNMSQRAEYLNQAPIMIALFKNTMVDTPAGNISLWEGFNTEWEWDTTQYGEKPTELIAKTRVKLDQIIKRVHGNYDNASPLAIKKTITGRALSQFRTWLYESVANRVEKESYDDVLGTWVKGRYRSVGTVFNDNKALTLGGEFGKNLLSNLTFGMVFKGQQFNNLVDKDGNPIKAIDASNMRKVVMEVTALIDTYLLLLLMSALMGDDDDENKKRIANILFNQGARLKTDMLLYVNPMEARSIVKDIIPAVMVIDDSIKWIKSIGKFLIGEDELKSGVHAGESRLVNSSLQMIPFGSKVKSTVNASSQVFDK